MRLAVTKTSRRGRVQRARGEALWWEYVFFVYIQPHLHLLQVCSIPTVLYGGDLTLPRETFANANWPPPLLLPSVPEPPLAQILHTTICTMRASCRNEWATIIWPWHEIMHLFLTQRWGLRVRILWRIKMKFCSHKNDGLRKLEMMSLSYCTLCKI